MNNKILVSDMGGVLYSFHPSFAPEKHEEEFNKAMLHYGKTNATVKEQIKAEWKAVKNGLLKIYPLQEGIKYLTINSSKYKIVIVSTSLVKTSKFILNRIGLKNFSWKIFDMTDFGSKKDPDAWKNIFSGFEDISIILEDSNTNLKAAKLAANHLGFSPKTYSSVPENIDNGRLIFQN